MALWKEDSPLEAWSRQCRRWRGASGARGGAAARRSPWLALAAGWWLLLAWGEAGVFTAGVHCLTRLGASAAAAEPEPEPGPEPAARAARVVVLADPQLSDSFSYRQPEGSLGLRLVEHYSDLFMSRAFRRSIPAALGGEPASAVLFLGDLFDGAREMTSDAPFEAHRARFERIFGAIRPWASRALAVAARGASGGAAPQLFASGNHDIGFREMRTAAAAQRHSRLFGATSHATALCGHDLVTVDAVALAFEDSDPVLVRGAGAAAAKRAELVAARTAAQRFVRDYARAAAQAPRRRPVLLFSHVPLWRPDGAPCRPGGFPRQKPPLRMTQYKYILPRAISRELLDLLRPAAVFSGDEHDFCEYEHALEPDPQPQPAQPGGARPVAQAHPVAPEYTVATFSWLQGVRRPGLALIHLDGCQDGQEPQLSVQLCALPDQLAVYLAYAAAALLTAAILVADHCCFADSRGAKRAAEHDRDLGQAAHNINIVELGGLSRDGIAKRHTSTVKWAAEARSARPDAALAPSQAPASSPAHEATPLARVLYDLGKVTLAGLTLYTLLGTV
jgi:hypothetical protein